MCYKERFQEGAIVKLCVLASGSSGNCTLIATERTRLLVDAGLSRREILKRLVAIGERPENVDGIVISHEHSDHIAGLPVLARWLNDEHRKSGRRVPVYVTHATSDTLDWQGREPPIERFQAGTRLAVGDIEIGTFTIPHDAVDPIAFSFRAQGIKIGMVTDLGYIPDSIKFHLRGTHLLVLESNHDLEMLKVGPYPWAVKQRVMARTGHLSNDVVSEFIRDDLDASTATLVLGHLSEHNNHPELVRLTAGQALAGRALATRLVVAEHGRATEVFQF